MQALLKHSALYPFARIYPTFVRKFENRVTIDRYVSEKVLSEFSSDIEKQQQVADGFNNARILTQVVYYDKELEAIAKSTAAGSGCGRSCTRS